MPTASVPATGAPDGFPAKAPQQANEPSIATAQAVPTEARIRLNVPSGALVDPSSGFGSPQHSIRS
jgi:hypothetical protein